MTKIFTYRCEIVIFGNTYGNENPKYEPRIWLVWWQWFCFSMNVYQSKHRFHNLFCRCLVVCCRDLPDVQRPRRRYSSPKKRRYKWNNPEISVNRTETNNITIIYNKISSLDYTIPIKGGREGKTQRCDWFEVKTTMLTRHNEHPRGVLKNNRTS